MTASASIASRPLNDHQIYGIAGLPRHGKSTMASLMARWTGGQWGDTVQLIYEALAQQKHTTVDELRKIDKSVLRGELIRVGDALCAEHGPDALVCMGVDRGWHFISGVRKPDEWIAFKTKFPRAQLIWVEAPNLLERCLMARRADLIQQAVNPEEIYGADFIQDNTNPALRQHADVVVRNITLTHLSTEALWLTRSFYE